MLTSDFREFAALLNSNAVEYLVVGGYALAAYGHPRYTGDLDFWVEADPATAEKAVGRHQEPADLEALESIARRGEAP